jgi:hypothetical protein
MANTLHIPEGLTLTAENGKVALITQGDVVVEGPLHGDISRVESINGTITVRGPVSADRIVAQAVRIEGHLKCQELLAHTGSIQMRGLLEADSVVATLGDMVVRGPTRVGSLRAGGTLRVDGPRIEARLLQADIVRFRGGTIKARGIEAQSRINLGPCAFTVEVCIAPQVDVDPKAAGRINVLESRNVLANNALKGRFRLQEYAEFTGVDPEAFLREREVRPLSDLGAEQLSEGEAAGSEALDADSVDELIDLGLIGLTDPVGEPTSEEESTEQTGEAPTQDIPDTTALLAPEPPPLAPPEPLPDAKTPMHELEPAPLAEEAEENAEPEQVEDSEEPPAPQSAAQSPRKAELADSLNHESTDSSTMAPPGEPRLDLSAETQAFLNQSVTRLAKHYSGEEPPAISRLRDLVSTQEYAMVRDELKDLFNSVVRGHISTGTRPHPQVLSDFNAIHDVMKRA